MCGKAPCEKAGCTWSEQYRAQCEARVVMRWEKDRRQAYYQKVAKTRGEAAARALIAVVRREWKEGEAA
jgi:hypothetical protein